MRIPATSQNENDYKNQNLRKHCKPYRRSVDCSEMKRCKHDERIGERLAMIEEEEVKWHRFNSSNSMSFSPTSSCNQKSISNTWREDLLHNSHLWSSLMWCFLPKTHPTINLSPQRMYKMHTGYLWNQCPGPVMRYPIAITVNPLGHPKSTNEPLFNTTHNTHMNVIHDTWNTAFVLNAFHSYDIVFRKKMTCAKGTTLTLQLARETICKLHHGTTLVLQLGFVLA
jgi:hypothetical protein